MFSNYRTFSWNKGQHCIVAMLLGLCFFVAPAGAQTVYTYQKSLGKSGKTIQSPYGYDMQFAHEDRVVIYRIPSATPFMLWRNAEAFYTYARWYNYENNQTIPGLTLKSVTSKSTNIYTETSNIYATANSGQIWCKTSGYQQFCSNAEYTYNPSNGTDVVYIGCDQSSYLDTKVDATNLTFTEPTLSQRMVFEIHPASEMAEKVDDCDSGHWLEEYDIMAPTGSTVFLGPKYAILDAQMKSSIESGSLTGTTYPAYYYTNSSGNVTSSGSSAFLTNSGSSPQCTITNDNWVEAPATVTQTTTYECIKNYSINCPTWNLSETDFSNPTSITSNGVRSGEHTGEDGLTWHWELRPYKSKSATPNASYLGQVGDYVQIGNTDDNYRSDSLIVTVTIPDNKTIDNIYVDCYSEYTNSNPPRICIWSRANNSAKYVDHKTQYLGGTASKPTSIDIVPHEYYVNDKNSPLVNKVIQVVLGPQTIASATFVKSICITYKGESTHHIQGEVQDTEPADAEKAYWKKVVVDNTVKHWSKQQTIACTTAGWIWIKNGEMQEVDITKMSAGQYIPLDPVISQRVDTLELVYNSGQGTGTTTFQRDTTINHRTVYLYSSETNQWEEKADSTQHIVMPAAEKSKTTNTSKKAKQYHIAQFRVQYLNRDIVGPRAAELNDFVNNMELIAEQDFNFGYGENKPVTTIKDANKDNARVFYPHPLDAEASYYGFYYGSDADRNGSYKAKCSFNEYEFVNNGFGWIYNDALSNHVGNSTNHDKRYGFALYADGSQKPGTVFTIEFGAQLCPGAKMFFSAWIGDQNFGSYTTGHPIFNFYVEGLDAKGNAHVLATFTTGEFYNDKDQKGWHHILFPLEFSDDIDYERFRYRIENMAATTSNNDFFLDDVRVYLQRAEISPVQASLSNHASCLYDRQDMVLYTRVDYGEMLPEMEQTTSDTRSFYYRWYDAEGNPIPAKECHYAGHAIDNNIPYGKVTIPSDPNNLPSTDIMASFSAFDNAYYNLKTTDNAVVKYVREKCVNHDQDLSTSERFVAYIATPVTADLGKTYRCVVTYAQSFLPDKDATIDQTELCSNKADVTVVNGLCIRCKELGGLVPGGTQAQANANNAYELTLVSETMRNKNNILTRQVDCYFGYWLFGREIKSDEDNAEEKRRQLEALYGTTYDNVKAAIQAYIANTADADQQKIVKRLSTIGALKLSNSKLMADTSLLVLPLYDSDTISFTAFPFCDLTGSKDNFCHDPISISLTFPRSTTGTDLFNRNSLYFVKKHDEDVPKFLPNLHPRQVRIPKDSVQQHVPIRLTNTESTYVLKTARLYSTNNTAVPADVAKKWNWMDDTNPTITGKTPHKVLFKYLNELPEGYKYTFRVAYDVTDQVQGRDTTYEGEAFITFIVVPDVVYYAGSKGDVWNDDEKWQFKKPDGKKAAAWVPLPSTKVVFEKDYVVLPPISQPSIQERGVEADAVPYITYDINYAPYSCSNVYIARGVSLLGQQRLNTINPPSTDTVPTKWTLELPVLTQKWKMNAIPLQSVVLGDMFVPDAGESTTDLFAVKAISQEPGEYASDRMTHKFYNSLYNKDANQYLGRGEYESIKNSTWTFATNILDYPVDAGYGWALGYDGNEQNFKIRLPKVDDMYRYFNHNAGEKWTQEEEHPDRSNAGKAMFTPDSQGKMRIELENEFSSNIFLFGNPTFAYIDLAKLKESFNTENSANSISIEGFYKAGVDANSRYQLAAALPTDAASAWLSSVNKSLLTANDKLGLLAPTEAVFIKLNTSLETISFNIALSMLCDKNKKYYGDDTPTPLSAPAAYTTADYATDDYTTADYAADDYANADASAIFISASLGNYESSTSIYDHPEAEVELFMLDKAKTPFAIYTVGNNKALAINHLRDDQTRIPLVMFAEDPVERPLFTFSGDPRYIVEWDLVDIVSGVRQPLYDSLTIHLNMPQDGNVRYYLERSRHGIYTSESKTDAFRTYAYGGLLTIYSEEPLYDLRIYDAAGRLLQKSDNPGTSFTATLTAGAYLVRASGTTCKVIVP